ncbi:MAG TPA: hypothetical protein VIG46_11790 [Candidatus Baltobacteraceae bacterium]|jgi:hypothetical protein
MEQYSIDGRGRSEVYLTLALVSVLMAYLSHQEIGLLPFGVPWWIEVPSFAVWFGLINVCFDRWLWRIRVLGLRLSEIPNFSGVWEGTIRAHAPHGGLVDIPVKMRIRQTWSAIDVKGETAQGVTRSKMAGVRLDDEELRYEFETHADVLNEEGKHHVGFGVLQLRDADSIEGFYYTLEGTTRKGTMRLVRASAVKA